MKNIFLLISVLSLHGMFGQALENKLLLLKNGIISIYDTISKDSIVISSLPVSENWKIGKVSIQNDTLKILTYNNLEYLNFNIDGILQEKIFIVNLSENADVVVQNNRIFDKGNSLVIEIDGGNPIKLKESDLYERYENKTRSDYFSEEGSLYFVENDMKTLYMENCVSESKIDCGYFQPDISSNGEFLICEYRCSKYNGKKQIGESVITEVNVKTKKFNKLNLKGYNPKYSNDGEMILYQNKDEYYIYVKNTNANNPLQGVTQAFWIK